MNSPGIWHRLTLSSIRVCSNSSSCSLRIASLSRRSLLIRITKLFLCAAARFLGWIITGMLTYKQSISAKSQEKHARLEERLLFLLGQLHRFGFLLEEGFEDRELCSEWCSDGDCETVITCNETESSRNEQCMSGSHHRFSAKRPESNP
jgi:hypothetical protein